MSAVAVGQAMVARWVERLAERSPEEDYERQLRRVCRAYLDENVGAGIWYETMVDTVVKYVGKAFDLGAKDAGVEADELTDAERVSREFCVAEQVNFIPSLQTFLDTPTRAGEQISLTALLTRLDLWVNTFGRVREMAKMLCGRDGKYLWVHNAPQGKACCEDCLRMNGRVYRSSVWRAAGVYPGSPSLACRGFECHCSLEATNDRGTPGPVPELADGGYAGWPL